MKSSRFCVEFVFLLRLTQLNSLLSLSSSLQRLNPYSLHHVRISSPNQPLQQIANPIKHTVLSSTYITQDKNFGNDLVGQSPRGVMAPTHKPNLNLLDYLWPKDAPYLRVFLILAMGFMFLGKWFNVRVPFILQSAVDSLSKAKQLDQISTVTASVTSSFLLYGFSKAMSVVSAEIKTVLFAHVSFNGLRKFANQIFQHLHELDAEFHLKTPSGVISVAYVRAIRGFQTLLFQIVFSVIPAFLELFLVSQILYKRCGRLFSNITLGTFSLYLAFTVWITQWRIAIRQEMVDVDNARNGYFIDSILNHEVVKYFTNEQRESQKFDSFLRKLQKLNIDSTYAIALLNFGQAFMFCGGLTASLLAALSRVQAGTMSVGDLVAVNSMLLQLSIPFNFMGYTYQELRQAIVDMSFMRNVLNHVHSPVFNDPSLPDLDTVSPPAGPSTIEFKNVYFRYPAEKQDVLCGVSFKIQPGQNVAIVGPSGSGKSTTLRLITRMFDVSSGAVVIDNTDTREVTVNSLRRRIAVVPQDTSLFDETIQYNLLYGNASATDADIEFVLEKCNLKSTILKMPFGLMTPVGERGARLSGGERQKVSIARALLKNPSLILCDEVTSAVDAFAERDITDTLRKACESRTTVTIAHRLSSITHCDNIIVMNQGQVVEQGTHQELLKSVDGMYSRMWRVQNQTPKSKESDLMDTR